MKTVTNNPLPLNVATGFNEISSVIFGQNYPDIARISNEVLQHSKEASIPITLLLNRLRIGEPWDYIRGYTNFCRQDFIVNQSVLIPRIETETLVKIALELVQKHHPKSRNSLEIIDIGTGSGCILISLIKELKELRLTKGITKFTGLDISEAAIKIASKNAQRLLENQPNLLFYKSDLLKQYKSRNTNCLKIITANLPYVCESEKTKLDLSVIDWEPSLALFDTSKDGLGLTKALIDQAISKFDRFCIVFEIDPEQTSIMKQYLNTKEFYQMKLKVKFHKDQFNRMRFLEICRI